jgi:GINS complex subunit 4
MSSGDPSDPADELIPLPLPASSSFLPLPSDLVDDSANAPASSAALPSVSALSELHHCWLNERGSPELLFYEEDIVNACKRLLDEQQRFIDKLYRKSSKQANNSLSSTDSLAVQLYELERDRVNYLLNSYHRCRLWKIEHDPLYLLASKQQFDRLSPAEQAFARRYCDLIDFHFARSFLNGLPEGFRSLLQTPGIASQPNLDRFVAFQVIETLGVAEVDEQEIDLQKGRIFFGQYRLFKELLFQEKIRLV